MISVGPRSSNCSLLCLAWLMPPLNNQSEAIVWQIAFPICYAPMGATCAPTKADACVHMATQRRCHCRSDGLDSGLSVGPSSFFFFLRLSLSGRTRRCYVVRAVVVQRIEQLLLENIAIYLLPVFLYIILETRFGVRNTMFISHAIQVLLWDGSEHKTDVQQ